jgi:hypothetical protein
VRERRRRAGRRASFSACARAGARTSSPTALTTDPDPLPVYKIPPRPSLSGWKAQDWGENSFIWEGRLRIVESGNKAVLKLEVRGHLPPALPAEARAAG